jgi:hypothetical protein
VEHHIAAMRLQSIARGRLQRRRLKMTPQQIADERAALDATKKYMALCKMVGKVVGNPEEDGVVPVTFEDDGVDSVELAKVIAVHNGGQKEPSDAVLSPVANAAGDKDNDDFDDVSSEVSSVASLPDDLKDRYLEFDMSDED